MRWDPAGVAAPTAGDATRDPAEPDAEGSDASTDGASTDGATTGQSQEKDFRPEGRRSSFAPAFIAGESSDRADASLTAVSSAGSGGSAFSRDDLDLAAPERTMTRRELRILRARAEAAGLPAPDVMSFANGETTFTGAIPILDGIQFQRDVAPDADAAGVVIERPLEDSREEDSREEDSAEADSAEADRLASSEPGPELPADDETSPPAEADSDASAPAPPEPVDDAADEVRPVIPALVEPDPAGGARFPVPSGPGDAAPPEIVVDAEPMTGDLPVSDATATEVAAPPERDSAPAPGSLRPFDALFLAPSARAEQDGADSSPDTSSEQPTNDVEGLRGDILAAPAGAARPFGHWSTQDDDADEASPSRGVGIGVVTTHALVLPSIPDAGEPLMSPLTSTGEVMVTGIVELPKSFGATGAHPALFDHPEVDSLIDDADREDTTSSVAPVRATKAVSSTTTTRSMVETAPRKRSRIIPIVAICVGGVVLVAAASWAIAALFFNAF